VLPGVPAVIAGRTLRRSHLLLAFSQRLLQGLIANLRQSVLS
jgi:hypothetical protein